MKYNERTIRGIYKRVIGTMSGLADINVEIHPQIVPHYEPKTKTIRMPSSVSYAQNSEEEFLFGRGICVHEASHVLFVPKITGSLRRQEDKDFWEWFNVFADANNEYKTAQVFPNLGKPLAEKTEALFKLKPELLSDANPFLQTLMRIDKVAKINADYPKDYNPDLKKFVEKVVDRFNKNKICGCKGSKLIRFTQEVFEDWRTLKKKHESDKKLKDPQIKKLMELMGNKIKQGGCEEQVKALEKKISGLSKCKQPWFDDKQGCPVVRATPILDDNLSEETLKKVIDKIKKLAKKAQEDAKKEGLGIGAGTSSLRLHQIRPNGDANDLYDIKRAHSKGKVINRMLKRRIKLQEELERRHRNGKEIDIEEVRRQIAKAGRITNAQVFQRDNTFQAGGEWAVEILVDCSGSMDGHNMEMAKQALATLGYAIDGLPNVHWALTGYNYGKDGIYEFQVKKFNDPRFHIEQLKKLQAGGGTPTNDCVKNSAHRLMRYPRLKKLMVVITDGQPAFPEETAKTIKMISKKIKMLGIGIEGIPEELMEKLFPTYYMFNIESANLEGDLTNLILEALDQKEKVSKFKKSWELL